MKKIILFLVLILSTAAFCFGEDKGLLLDDFEGVISGGPKATVDFGAGGGSTIEVKADTNIKYSGNQSIKIVYDALTDGYMWIAKGFDLDAQNATWMVKPQDIDWLEFNAFAFYMYGSNSKTKIAFDIKDNGNEMWRFIVQDNFTDWKEIVCPFDKFFVRDDWQPDNAQKNATLDVPIKSFQFEPLPEAKGVVYFDAVELIKQ